MNPTKIHVPNIANINAKNALDHNVEAGIKSSANKIPNWAEEIVAPVVGETNLFIHNCCMINPATLIPIPVHKIASKRGNREIKKISNCSKLPDKTDPIFKSITPTNNDIPDNRINMIKRHIVE